jgi:hypothetical protein
VYSRNHCLTRMPTKAEVKAETRLENHNVFTATAYVSGLKSDGKVKVEGKVEFTKPLEVEKLSSFDEISARIWTIN